MISPFGHKKNPTIQRKDLLMAVPTFQRITPPQMGSRITVDPNGRWQIPDDPVVCLIRGDGIGMDFGGVPGISTSAVKVFLRIKFDLYACVRPVKYYKGVEAPNKRADKVDMVIFRENTEDVYCGIEFQSGTDKARKLIDYINKEFGYTIRPTSGIGIKP